MDWSYISGFFDADGYITLIRDRVNKPRVAMLGFTNTKREMLEAIQEFIEKETGIKGFISKKKAKKKNHAIGYDLKYVHFPKVMPLFIKMKASIHPKKQKRYKILIDIYQLTPRNGKYPEGMKEKRALLENQFLETL